MCRAIIIDGVSTHFAAPSPRFAMLREALEDGRAWLSLSMANKFDPLSANKIDPLGATKNQRSRLYFSR